MIFISRPAPIRFKKTAWLRRKIRRVINTSDAKRRSALIGEIATIPSTVTDRLASHRSGKCWYCERKLTRQELVVEHFRPKRRVTLVPGHPGYYWLSANTKNFRIACANCNCRWTNPDGVVAGKGNHFPLMSEAQRVLSGNSDLRVEQPVIYDPLVQADCEGLVFTDDGTCLPASSDYLEVNRGFVSITLYNLNNPRLVDDRKALWGDLFFKMELAQALQASDPLYDKTIENIRASATDHAQYAGLARSAIRKMNSTLNARI